MDLLAKQMNEFTHNNSLEEDEKSRKEMEQEVLAFADAFLEELPKMKAFQHHTHAAVPQDSLFAIGGDKVPLETILKTIQDRVVNTGLNPASGGHLGYIPGGGLYSAALGDYLAAVTNRYAGVFYASPGAVRMEDALIDWCGRLIGYEKGFGGNLTSGGSLANLIALATAKKAKKITSKNILKQVIYCSQQAHHSIFKAIQLVGLEECVVRQLPLDPDFRLSVTEFKRQLKTDLAAGLSPFLLVANAGSTDVGAIDPLSSLAAICRQNRIWFHVDAAYGGFFALTSYGKERLRDLNKADSVILDPHKGMFMPYGSGIVLVKNIAHLANAHCYAANYMQDATQETHLSPADLSPELSKHFRGLRMWLPLKLYGTEAFSAYLEEKLELTNYLYEQLVALGFTIACKPALTIIAFRYDFQKGDSDGLNRQLLTYLLEDGQIFISSTVLKRRFTLRAAILSFRTHKREVDLFIALLKNKLEDLME